MIRIEHLPEPRLEFRNRQAVSDPRDGLALFGPYDADAPSHPRGLAYAAVGTNSGLAAFDAFAARVASPILPDQDLDPRVWAPFPGFEAAYACAWARSAARTVVVDAAELEVRARHRDPNRRAFEVVEPYLDAIGRIVRRDDPVHVVVCVVPDVVYANCRPLSRVKDALGDNVSRQERQARRKGQSDFFDAYDPEMYRYSVDFRRQLKARAMPLGVPVQIVRESTLRLVSTVDRGARPLTPLCDRAWNLTNTLFYKAGGKPWRLTTARDGVCYLGVAFKRTSAEATSNTACCAAQMFLDSGDGIVFMGEYGPWYSPTRKQCHLSSDSAERLIRGALETYQSLEGKPLRELFIHSRSTIDEEEFAGFARGAPPGVSVVGIRVRQDRQGIRLYRESNFPVLRGALWQTSHRHALLWTSGYKPELATYDGWETPAPLAIDVQWGDADAKQVAADILGLTKLNYNACRLGESSPVTVGFSDAVGEILVANSAVEKPSPKFKFYI